MSKKIKVDQTKKHDAQKDTTSAEVNGVEQSYLSDNGVNPGSLRKRKRDKNEENIEIDLSLPEPPNKKALRKAKKLKKVGKSEDASAAVPANGRENAASSADNQSEDGGFIELEATPTKVAPSAKPRSIHSIWIGNLPFSATKVMLTDFLIKNAQPPISRDNITRMHIPAPTNAKSTKTQIKPMNKGFAYVDFADQQSFMAALALSETPLGGRNVLIKDAKNFEGRPSEHEVKQQSGTNKVVSKRVFVGNLAFDVTVDDLEELFGKCGSIEHLHMATFEDSGKCKGYAWITFATEDASKAAVKGVAIEEVEDSENEEDKPADGPKRRKRRPKKRQWWCNRLHGREVSREFAEDASVRYNKRFGKGMKDGQVDDEPTEEIEKGGNSGGRQALPIERNTHPYGLSPGAPTNSTKRRGRTHGGSRGKSQKEKEIAERTQYRTGQVAESQGSKITFV